MISFAPLHTCGIFLCKNNYYSVKLKHLLTGCFIFWIDVIKIEIKTTNN